MRSYRFVSVFLLLLLVQLPSQTCFYSDDADPIGPLPPGATGPRLYFPHNGAEYYRRHVLVPIGVFQNVPAVITDISVGARSGWSTYSFRELTVRMGHTNATALSTTFAANITSPLQDVLVANEHVWTEGLGPSWVALGLQQPFQVLPGSGNLLIEIITRDAATIEQFNYNLLGSSTAVSTISGTGSTVPTVTFSSTSPGPRLRFCIDHAETSLQGLTCDGSAGSTPLLGVTGRPTPGATPTIWLSDAPPNAVAACAYGFDNAPPFPIDLTPLGAPGCRQYFSIAFADLVVANNLGIGQRTILVPATSSTIGAILFAQWFVLDSPANALGMTASNYARMLVGL